MGRGILKANEKEANQICNSYLATYIRFLQDIYDKFNKFN